MLDRKVSTILTSSCGRLFDAVAFLAGLGDASLSGKPWSPGLRFDTAR
jgi:hydrogenase maturation factor HypF (carbamoyltransferase family)